MNARKSTIAVLVGALIGSLFVSQSAEAKAPKARTLKGTYATPAVGILGQGGGQCFRDGGRGCVEFTTKEADHLLSITVTDASGKPVYASISQDKVSDDGQVHQTTQVAEICGSTAKPVVIDGGYPVDVFIWEGPSPDGACSGPATQGTVTAKISG
jgi:hypothetical protein